MLFFRGLKKIALPLCLCFWFSSPIRREITWMLGKMVYDGVLQVIYIVDPSMRPYSERNCQKQEPPVSEQVKVGEFRVVVDPSVVRPAKPSLQIELNPEIKQEAQPKLTPPVIQQKAQPTPTSTADHIPGPCC